MTESSEQTPLLEKKEKRSEFFANKWRKFKLEPALLLVFFGWDLSSSIIQNQLLQQACLYQGYNSSDCFHLGENNATVEIEKIIQPIVAEISMTSKLLMSVIPAFLSLFFGTWSDKFGRKKVLVSTFIGYTTSLVCFSIISITARYVAEMSPWMYLLPYIPLLLSGGWPSMIVAVSCYTADISSESDRSARFGIIEMIIFLGILCGDASSSFILKSTSSTSVFIISTVCVLIALIYTIKLVPESVQVRTSESLFEQLKELFSPKPIVQMIKTCFKKRRYNENTIVWSVITILVLSTFTVAGSSNVFYLFARRQLHWTLREFTLFDSTTILLSTFGCFIGIAVLKKRLNFSDISIMIIGVASKIIDALIIGFATESWQLYLASTISLFRILIVPMNQSIITKFIPKDEVGKIFSMKTSLEAISSLLSSPLYTFVYTKTFTSFTGAYFMITALISTFNLLLALCVARLITKRQNNLYFENLTNEDFNENL